MISRQLNSYLFTWLLAIIFIQVYNEQEASRQKEIQNKFSETKITGEFNAGAKVCDEIDKEKWNKGEVIPMRPTQLICNLRKQEV